MDGTAAINHNLEALKRILAGLVSMAGLSVSRACGEGPHPEAHVSPELVEGAPRKTLPRHLRLAILRLLRPAESAARRLIIAAARGLVVTLPCQRKPKPKPATVEPFLRRFGIAVEERVGHSFPSNGHNDFYLATKASRFGHLLF